jgi:ERCC4-type nuclease
MIAPVPLVLVDDREPKSTISRLQALGLSATLAHLDSADYCFFAHGLTILIERKTISNLLQSLSDKQMVHQAHKMVASSDRCFILREGDFRRGPSGHLVYYSPRDPRAGSDGYVTSGWDWGSFSGMMLDLQLMGIGFIDCSTLGEYPVEIARAVINLSKQEHRWIKERQRPDVESLDSQYTNAVWSLCAFAGIGPEWAQGLLSEGGSIANVVATARAAPQELAAIKLNGKSFGKKRAERLQKEVTQEWKG